MERIEIPQGEILERLWVTSDKLYLIATSKKERLFGKPIGADLISIRGLKEEIRKELDRAREEGFRIMFEGLDNIARNSSEGFYEGVAIIKLRNEITRLYKLKTKEDGK